MRREARVRVGTLYAGERELPRCVASLRDQDHAVSHHVVSGLPNREAHRALRRDFMEHSGEFDLYVKLDADMVLRRRDAIRRLVELFRSHPGLDHAELAVRDWFSDSLIMGLHAFSTRVAWRERDEDLFVDVPPEHPGYKLELWTEPAPLADHCPDPSPQQAFHFGVHRARKALQRGRPPGRFDRGQAREQLRVLCAAWRHFERSRDPRLGLAVLGATRVLEGVVFDTEVDQKASALAAPPDEADLDAGALHALLAPRWRRSGRLSLAHAVRAQLRHLRGRLARAATAGA